MAEDLGKKQDVVEDGILMYLKANLKQEWRDVGRYLGVSDADINHLESDFKGNQKEINHRMLLKWKEQKGGNATYNRLAEALKKAGRQDLADNVNKEKRLQASSSGGISKKQKLTEHEMATFEKMEHDLPKGIFTSFIENLKQTYKRLTRAVRPVPYVKDWRCVGEIFVESKLDEMEDKMSESGKERWTPVSSYYDIAIKGDPKRLLLDGDPGFGKSTLALQMAYEWCSTDKESPLSQIDIFILIRLREVRNVESIFRVIKLLLLPKECTLKEEDIQKILAIPNLRLVFILDGFDEFAQTDEDCDIYSIIRGEMFSEAKVVVTTRPDCTSSLMGPDMKRMRLTGFDESMQNLYIQKALFPSESAGNSAQKLKKVFKENDLLADICQVPLFFVMFAHLVKDQPDLEKQQSITAYYSYMIKCFFSHMMNKEKTPFKKNRSIKEDQTLRFKLGKLGFDGLAQESQNLIWNKDILVAKLGDDGYERYKNVGILLEEEVFHDRNVKGQHFYDEIEYDLIGKFFHKTVQEYYAANHLVKLLTESDDERKACLHQFKPSSVRYLFLFACGLNDKVAELVINYLKDLENQQGIETAILCLMELGDLKECAVALKKLTGTGVNIGANQTKLLQRAKVNLVQNSCRHKVFTIEDEGREWGTDEFHEIIKYASKCDGLKGICFSRCLIPFDFPRGRFLSDLLDKDVTVQWNSPHTECSTYHMNLRSLKWERQAFSFYHPELHGQLLLQEDYNRLKMVFRGDYRDTDWQKTHIPFESTPTVLIGTPTGSFRMPVRFMHL